MVIKKEITAKVELITPDRSRLILEGNTMNRAIIASNVKKIACAIREGRWQLNGDAIRISITGQLLDGQHRLQAIIETGIPCLSFIIEGLPDEVFTTIDQGAPRTLGHLLSIKNVKNYTCTASMITLIVAYENVGTPLRSSVYVSKESYLKFYEENSLAIDRASCFASSNKILRAWFSPSYLGFLYYVFSEKNQDQAASFFSAVSTGNSDIEISQALLLRERMIAIFCLQKTKQDDSLTKAAYCVFAWNNFRKGKAMKLIRWKRRGDQAESFPTIF